jgi:hypothetical protein
MTSRGEVVNTTKRAGVEHGSTLRQRVGERVFLDRDSSLVASEIERESARSEREKFSKIFCLEPRFFIARVPFKAISKSVASISRETCEVPRPYQIDRPPRA